MNLVLWDHFRIWILYAPFLFGREYWDSWVLSSMMQIYLGLKERNTTEYKLEAFLGVNKKLTMKRPSLSLYLSTQSRSQELKRTKGN
jgi:hypothetical protein